MNFEERKTGGFKSIALTALLLSIIVLFSSCSSGSVDVKVKAEFWEAVEMSDNTRAINLAKKNPWLLKEFGNGGWTLVLASRKGNLELVKFLIENGIDVNIKSRQYLYTALHGAVNSRNLELVEYLVENGAEINCKDPAGWSPVHSASGLILEYLISKGADINIKDRDGRTPLYCACYSGDLDFVRYLISKGADTSVKDSEGKNILHPAIQSGNYELIRYLESMGLKPSDPDTVLIDAIHSNKLDVVKHCVESGVKFDKKIILSHVYNLKGDYYKIIDYLLSKGAQINSSVTREESILFTAVESDDLKLVKLLLSKGGDPNLKNSLNTPVIFHALGRSKNTTEIIKLLISEGANVYSYDGDGNSLINIAVIEGKRETVEFLESKGAIPGVKGIISPLHLSSYTTNIGVMKYFIDKGISVNVRDSEGNTPLHYICCNESITDINPKINSNKGYGIEALDVAIVEYLVSKGARVDVKNNKGLQPIHFAALNNSYDYQDSINVIEYFVSKGVDINAGDNEGNTPLHFAADKDEGALFIDKLISLGASVNVKNRKGETPLSITVKGYPHCSPANSDTIRLLMSRGAIPGIQEFKVVLDEKVWELLPILLFENRLILSGLISSFIIFAVLLILLFRGRKKKGNMESAGGVQS